VYNMSKCPALHSVVQLSSKCGKGKIISEQLSKTDVKIEFLNVFDRFLKIGLFSLKFAR